MNTTLAKRRLIDNPKLIPLIEKAADFFRDMINAVEMEIQDVDNDLIGPPRLKNEYKWNKQDEEHIVDSMHFPLGTGQLMLLGFRGIADAAAANSKKTQGLESEYLSAISTCHNAACEYASKWAAAAKEAAAAAAESGISTTSRQKDYDRLCRIAAACKALSQGAPKTFQEALQLFWFALPIRNAGSSSTLGRLDQHFYPFYARDLKTGAITPQRAQEMIDELLEKINRIWIGDGLMTLVVGGLTKGGDDATNAVSRMFVDAATRLRLVNPQINVRIHSETPGDFRDVVTTLQLTPGGECTILNDEAIIPTLIASGVNIEMARNYCCDGCNELIYDGESLIVFFAMEAVKCLELTLFNGAECPVQNEEEIKSNYLYDNEDNPVVSTSMTTGYESGDFTQMSSFDQVLDAFFRQHEFQIRKFAERLARHISAYRSHNISPPFLAGTFPDCLSTGTDPLRGGIARRVFMLFSGSIPTVADGLAAIRKVVFEDKTASPSEMLQAITADWVGHDALRQQCLAAPKFGNDDESVDSIAAEIADRFAECLADFQGEQPEPILPALFCHEFNRHAMIASATPDGRKRGEPIAEHFSPVPGRAVNGPTAVIKSIARAPLSKMAGTAVSHVSLSRASLPSNDQAESLLRQLVDSALAQGLMVLHMPIYDVDRLRDAQVHPELHQDLMVRVWGFSEKFVKLDRRVQDHIISRAIRN